LGNRGDLAAYRSKGSTAGALVDQIGELEQFGVQRVILQWPGLDDLAGLEAMAAAVLPQFSRPGSK
jgi:hypothetical protein